MTREEIVELMAVAMHERGYTSSFDRLSKTSQDLRRDDADAALEALEEAGLIDIPRWYR